MQDDAMISRLASAMYHGSHGPRMVAFEGAETKTREFYFHMAEVAINAIKVTHRMWRK